MYVIFCIKEKFKQKRVALYCYFVMNIFDWQITLYISKLCTKSKCACQIYKLKMLNISKYSCDIIFLIPKRQNKKKNILFYQCCLVQFLCLTAYSGVLYIPFNICLNASFIHSIIISNAQHMIYE